MRSPLVLLAVCAVMSLSPGLFEQSTSQRLSLAIGVSGQPTQQNQGQPIVYGQNYNMGVDPMAVGWRENALYGANPSATAQTAAFQQQLLQQFAQAQQQPIWQQQQSVMAQAQQPVANSWAQQQPAMMTQQPIAQQQQQQWPQQAAQFQQQPQVQQQQMQQPMQQQAWSQPPQQQAWTQQQPQQFAMPAAQFAGGAQPQQFGAINSQQQPQPQQQANPMAQFAPQFGGAPQFGAQQGQQGQQGQQQPSAPTFPSGSPFTGADGKPMDIKDVIAKMVGRPTATTTATTNAAAAATPTPTYSPVVTATPTRPVTVPVQQTQPTASTSADPFSVPPRPRPASCAANDFECEFYSACFGCYANHALPFCQSCLSLLNCDKDSACQMKVARTVCTDLAAAKQPQTPGCKMLMGA